MRQKEVQPLLAGGSLQPRSKTNDTIFIPEEKVDMGDEFEDEILLTERKKKRRVSMLWHDCLLMTLEFFQFLAVLQSMALRWTFSPTWLSNSYFFFLINLDVFEFVKMHTSGVYLSIQSHYTSSGSVPVSFSHITIAWFSVSLLLPAIFVMVYVILYKMNHPKFFTYFGYLRMVYFFIIQMLTLPVGTYIAHVFQCNGDGNVDMMNDQKCFEGLHWLYVAFALLLTVFFFIVFPVYLIYKTRQESLGSCSKHHESFLLLKETEYKVGLNKLWLISDVYLFSSFKFWGLYYRSVMQWVKMTILIVVFAGFHNIRGQALAVTIMFSIYFLGFLIIRPFRLIGFNMIMLLSFLALSALSLIGAMATSYTMYTLTTPWLLPQYSQWITGTIVILWTGFWILFVLYLCVRQLLYRCNCIKNPMWPTFSTSENDHLSSETKKFLKTFLRARFVLEKVQIGPVIFSPVHELARQIQILNAYCREAEFLGDALHGTMWDLLDEMIEIHSKLSAKSLFAESVKESIRRTAKQFMSVMPSFSQRLAQRDYDLILVSPLRRRMLLKMYIMGVFLNGRAEKVRKEQLLTRPALELIWHEEPMSKDLEEEEGYYEDLYPDPLQLIRDNDSVELSMDSSESEEELDFTNMMGQLKDEEELNADLLRQEEEVRSSQTSLRPPSASSYSKIQPSPSAGSLVSVTHGSNANEGFSSIARIDDSRPSTSKERTEETDALSLTKSDGHSSGHDNPALNLQDEIDDENKASGVVALAEEVIDKKISDSEVSAEKPRQRKERQKKVTTGKETPKKETRKKDTDKKEPERRRRRSIKGRESQA